MSTLGAPLADPSAPLARRNPVAKLGAALLFSLGLLATLDPLTPALALLVELASLPLFGIPPMSLFRRAWPLVVSAGGALLTMVLFGSAQGGDSIVHYGPLQVTTGTLSAGLGLALRVLAVAVPGVVVFASTDPTDLADALIQNVRAPARFAIGALAAFRLMPLLGDEWRMLTLARRARGIESGRGPWSRLRLFASLSFGLLVGAIRRGTRLATAMDARGFDSGLRRTRAREQHFGGADAALLAMAALLAACLVAISVAAGTFRPVL